LRTLLRGQQNDFTNFTQKGKKMKKTDIKEDCFNTTPKRLTTTAMHYTETAVTPHINILRLNKIKFHFLMKHLIARFI